MKINQFADVSLRVLMLLSAVGDDLLTTRALADAVGTPYNHVSKSVLRLSQLGFVEAVRGRSGGVRISATGRTLSVGKLLRMLDDRSDLAECHSGKGDCPLVSDCALRAALLTAREAFYASLDPVVISALPTKKQMGPVFVTLGTRPPG
ncbi:RrF2 family transcriptional regulator [Specibacter cremeus]|uniref:RrF2 family transcriptional regulator n=1 Tax=Specibacter cremeus TaxID=1629051 RepID=UPI000F79FE7A|nr:Rrf2 family transcriptional regulator [Specibacter cremeus]